MARLASQSGFGVLEDHIYADQAYRMEIEPREAAVVLRIRAL